MCELCHSKLNRRHLAAVGDPEIQTRIAQALPQYKSL